MIQISFNCSRNLLIILLYSLDQTFKMSTDPVGICPKMWTLSPWASASSKTSTNQLN